MDRKFFLSNTVFAYGAPEHILNAHTQKFVNYELTCLGLLTENFEDCQSPSRLDMRSQWAFSFSAQK